MSGPRDPISEALRRQAEAWVARRMSLAERWADGVGSSAIERILFRHLFVSLGGCEMDGPGFHLGSPEKGLSGEAFEFDLSYVLTSSEKHYSDYGWILVPQCPVGRYRADFVLAVAFIPPEVTEAPQARKFWCVECDGHDFHERTKEQAAHDRMRDRWFQAQGFAVLRFTGSEIVREGARCAAEVSAHVNGWLDQQRRLAGYPEEAFG